MAIFKIEDSKALIIKEKAKKFGLLPDQLVAASIEDLAAQPDPEFESAMKKILSKNKDLYERLS